MYSTTARSSASTCVLSGLPRFFAAAERRLFQLARADHGTVAWPQDIDFDPDTLYLDSQSVSDARRMSSSLSEHLPLLASAPDGIKKLRGLILELAVRGKLVPQEPDNDQSTWKRGLFSDFSLEYGDNLPAPKRTGTGEYPVYGSNGVVGTHNECRVQAPCIVVGRKGSAGALNLCRKTGCWVSDVAYCIPPSGVDLDFAFVLFHTLGLDNLGKGIKPGLSRNEAYSLLVGIPPSPNNTASSPRSMN